jgi:hypothetical protein
MATANTVVAKLGLRSRAAAAAAAAGYAAHSKQGAE